MSIIHTISMVPFFFYKMQRALTINFKIGLQLKIHSSVPNEEVLIATSQLAQIL